MFWQNDCGFYIKHINDALQRDANNELRSQNLTIAQLSALLQLAHSPDHELSLKDLEKRLQVAQSTAAGIIVRLEDKQFVESFTSPDDKRHKIVRLTPSGLSCCQKAQSHMKQTEQHLLSSLNDEERQTFTILLKKVSNSL